MHAVKQVQFQDSMNDFASNVQANGSKCAACFFLTSSHFYIHQSVFRSDMTCSSNYSWTVFALWQNAISCRKKPLPLRNTVAMKVCIWSATMTEMLRKQSKNKDLCKWVAQNEWILDFSYKYKVKQLLVMNLKILRVASWNFSILVENLFSQKTATITCIFLSVHMKHQPL